MTYVSHYPTPVFEVTARGEQDLLIGLVKVSRCHPHRNCSRSGKLLRVLRTSRNQEWISYGACTKKELSHPSGEREGAQQTGAEGEIPLPLHQCNPSACAFMCCKQTPVEPIANTGCLNQFALFLPNHICSSASLPSGLEGRPT